MISPIKTKGRCSGRKGGEERRKSGWMVATITSFLTGLSESHQKKTKQKTIFQAIVSGERVYVWLAYGGLGVDCNRRIAEELPTVPFCRDLTNASVQFSHSLVSNSLRPHGLQHTRLPCPSPTQWSLSNEACPNSCPSSW